jgi:hypothetical protein
MYLPVEIKRTDQISNRRAFSSFEKKGNPAHARLLDLVCDDSVSDLNSTARRGLANNIYFLLMRDLHGKMAGKRIIADEITLVYHYDTIKKCHRTKVDIFDATEYNEIMFSVCGDWVSDRAQALDSLRKVIESMVYGDN